MKLESLEELYKSMKAQSLDVQKFWFKLNEVTYEGLFSIRELPFVLTLTSTGSDPKFHKYEIQSDFAVADYIALPKHFFTQIDSLIPRKANINSFPSPSEIIRLRHDITEYRYKPYFDGWIYWSKGSNKSPTQENREKTLILLGLEAYDHSKQYNASSSWTEEPRAKNWKDEIKKTR